MNRRYVAAAAVAILVCAGWALGQVVPDKEYVVDENTILLLHLNDGQDVKDASALKNNGAGCGFVWTADGKFGGAADCTNGGLIVSSPGLPDAMTVEAWIKPSPKALTGYGTIAHKGFQARDGNDRLYFTLHNDVLTNFPSFAGNATLSADKWHHVAYVVTGTREKGGKEYFFVDGVLDKEQASAWNGLQAEGYMVIGSLRNAGEPFSGLIDEVRISNIARPYPGVQTGK